MEITRSLQDDIVKIQNELVTAIQNHQVLVLRQQVSPSDNVKTQIEEVQRHIICLGESQKLLVTRLRNELNSQSIKVNNKYKVNLSQRVLPKPAAALRKQNFKYKSPDPGRSLLVNSTNNQERERLLPRPVDRRQPSVDSSSEENRTPCDSPINGNSDSEQLRGSVKRSLGQNHTSPSKRHKSTLQATPRPSSPVPAHQQTLSTPFCALSSSSEESLDSLISQQPELESKIDFALSLGLITKDVYNRVIKKKSDRRRRKRVNSQHHLYNELWDLTVLQKRSRAKDDADSASHDRSSPPSDDDALCFVCRTGGDLRECRVCRTGCHETCVSGDICPACTHRICPPVSPLVAEKKRELERLRSNNKELHKSVSKLRERAKVLSDSLVMQTATVNQLVAKEEQLLEAIKRVKDFVEIMQGSQPDTS